MKPSDIYMAAWLAAEKALPAESRALIEAHDKLHLKWSDAGYGPVPAKLIAAIGAVNADPLASAVFELRIKTNVESVKEFEHQEKEAA